MTKNRKETGKGNRIVDFRVGVTQMNPKVLGRNQPFLRLLDNIKGCIS